MEISIDDYSVVLRMHSKREAGAERARASNGAKSCFRGTTVSSRECSVVLYPEVQSDYRRNGIDISRSGGDADPLHSSKAMLAIDHAQETRPGVARLASD